ncbi:PREDICTED: rootletin-like isoform X2 [Cercocebus atys]|uniref:rootletin-like isoform X2 n=1 Tax=Cercocebus atys TaxID=9531 RepID=UPI0005F3927C|nr:PREDICTED: rootletin-like isoform X2 [Cercocebus atys]
MSLGLAGAQEVELTLETVIQTLESSVLCQEKGLGTRDLARDAQTTSLPARIREIVTRNLSRPESPGGEPAAAAGAVPRGGPAGPEPCRAR